MGHEIVERQSVPGASRLECGDIFVVTVTYGGRREMLGKMIESVLEEGVRNIVVVDNGATWDVDELSSTFPSARFFLVPMGGNFGSAVGFSTGMKTALSAGAQMIWLLDDDNRPCVGALSELCAAFELHLSSGAKHNTAVLALRPDRQSLLMSGVASAQVRRSDFLGFHVLDVPGKIWRRLRSWNRRALAYPNFVSVMASPYSGLLLHREAIEAIGLPREDFVLYMDDTEWSSRLTADGGRIVLVTAARIIDLESSWNIKDRPGSRITGLLCGDGDFRAYYSTRNAAFLSASDPQASARMRRMNRLVYLLLLRSAALMKGRRVRYALLIAAIEDGENGRLGRHPEYPL